MGQLFNQDLPRLKLYFLQVDRLLCIVDPDLANHFSNEAITANFFAAAWFITLFTNQLSQNTDANSVVNEGLLQSWDYFLSCGWKAIVKLSLYMICSSREALI